MTHVLIRAVRAGLDAVPMYEEMIVTGAWWDYVDAVAIHHLGDMLRHDARRMKPLMRRRVRGRLRVEAPRRHLLPDPLQGRHGSGLSLREALKNV